MAIFDLAMPVVLSHEGGISLDPDDPGGATKYGISLRFLHGLADKSNQDHRDVDFNGDGHVDTDDIRSLKQEDAAAIYRRQFWDRFRYGRIHAQCIATKLFSLSVNMGFHAAHCCIQNAVRAASTKELVVDGVIGHKSIDAINKANPAILLAALKSEAAGKYRIIADRNPKLRKYLKGWLNRSYY
jgi:lysozyme family protein